MSAFEAPAPSLPERIKHHPRFARVAVLARALSSIERIALLAVVATPLALVADYRLGLAPIVRAYSFRPVAENGGYPISYEQLFGWTQIVWLLAGVVALMRPGTRGGFWSAPTALLVFFAAVLTTITAATTGIDQFAALALAASLVPIIAMCGLLLHPGITRRTAVWMISFFSFAAAAAVLATTAKDAIHHQLSERFSLFLFGSPTYAAAALVATALLTLALREVPSWLRIALVVVLALGVALTQTRGAIFGAAAGLLCIAVLDRRVRLTALAGVAVATLLLAFGPIRPLSNSSNTIRTHDVARHLHVLASRPIVGYGIAGSYADSFRGADNTLVGIADASGGVGAVIWISAWLLPIGLALRARRLKATTAFAAAAIAATFATWLTTGNEVLVYAPPTNLLPLVFAVALVEMARRRHDVKAFPEVVAAGQGVGGTGGRAKLVVVVAILVLLGVGVVAAATPARLPLLPNAPTKIYPGDGARALAAAQGLAFSSCGACRVISLVELSPRTWQAHLSKADLKPSSCFRVDLTAYVPRPPGQLPPGINWVPCAPELDRYGTIVPPKPAVGPNQREKSRARSIAKSVAEEACGGCRLEEVARVGANLWKWRVIEVGSKPSACFYVDLNRRSSERSTSSTTIWISCD
jgi:O-antigen ligase